MESDTRCACCGAYCQGYKAPNGKIYCADCYKKYSAFGLGKNNN